MADDPAAVFAEAQAAMGRGDWHAFFACHVPRDLELVAGQGLQLVLDPAAGAEVRSLAERRGVAPELLDALVAAAAAMATSAVVVTAARGAAQYEASLRHRDLVRAVTAATTAAVRGADDVAGLTADLEVLRRARFAGGGVSSSLYLDETLADVRIDGKAAVGTRRMRGGHTEPLVFALTRRGWLIRPFVRPPARLR